MLAPGMPAAPRAHPTMTFEQFEQRAAELWQQIPREYRAGSDGIRVERGARAHRTMDGVYTLGECLTESYPSDFGGPDTTRSLVVLYYGSFWRLARLDEEFDWETELWETLTHELQHHLESLADAAALEDLDYAVDENFKRLEGQHFDPSFYRAGKPKDGGWYQVEDNYFREFERTGTELEFGWGGERYRVSVPESRAEVLFLEVDADEPLPPGLVLVITREPGALHVLRSIFGGARRTVEEYQVSAERIADG